MNPHDKPPQIATPAPTTPATQPLTARCSTGKNENLIWLQTFDDPELIRLNDSVNRWWSRFLANDRPCWLTLCGKAETGKTHCAEKLWAAAAQIGRVRVPADKELYTPSKIWWPGFVNKLRGGNYYDVLEDTRRWPLLYLDEIGANRDNSGYVADQLYIALAQRDHKWTIITTNLTIEALTAMDERIASRCFRDDGIVVEVNTVPFSSRAKK